MIKNYLAAIIAWADYRFYLIKQEVLRWRFLKIGRPYEGDLKQESIIIHGSYSQESKDKRIEFNKSIHQCEKDGPGELNKHIHNPDKEEELMQIAVMRRIYKDMPGGDDQDIIDAKIEKSIREFMARHDKGTK